MTSTAVQRRYDAMERLTRVAYGRPEAGAPFLLTLADRVDTANAIWHLNNYGRTDRWRTAVDTWARAVSDAADLETLRWAFTQHSIWTAYAAE